MEDQLSTASARMVSLLADEQLTLATVESCTAGALASALAAAPGASRVLHGGFVVYSKAQKMRLGVSPSLIAAQTAVSPLVAEAMARAGLAGSPADLVLALTGVAGPEPDEDANPVGFVCVAAARGEAVVTEAHNFTGDRATICEQAMLAALGLGQRLLAAG